MSLSMAKKKTQETDDKYFTENETGRKNKP